MNKIETVLKLRKISNFIFVPLLISVLAANNWREYQTLDYVYIIFLFIYLGSLALWVFTKCSKCGELYFAFWRSHPKIEDGCRVCGE